MKFITDMKETLELLVNAANIRFPEIDSGEWSLEALFHQEGEPQLTLIHNDEDKTKIEITYPICIEEHGLKYKSMLVNRRGIYEAIRYKLDK